MRNLYIYLSALSVLSPALGFRHGAAQLRDLLAYPKYDVQFLNDLPISASDGERAQAMGLEKEDEWLSLQLKNEGRRRLDNGTRPLRPEDFLPLVPMSLVPPGARSPADYLCLMPEKNSTESQTTRQDLDEHVDLDPVASWAALSHLDGKCLYSKQGWFTYSYCHNSHIRQFREARHNHPHPPGGYEPEEDPTYDGYTLGQARHEESMSPRRHVKTSPKKNTRKTISDPSTSPSVSFAENASNRYLVQRWSDGTTCDKTGQPREVEVQIHCSMTSTDVIYLVKEMAICQYVVIIHSPHLCGLPGFRAPHADVQPAGIRCRQVISDEDFDQWVKGGKGDGTGAGREVLRLPWAKSSSDLQGLQFTWDSPKVPRLSSGSDDSASGAQVIRDDINMEEYEIEDEMLRKVLAEAFEAHRSDALDNNNGEHEDEFMLLSLEEDDEGNIVLGTDVMGGKKGAKTLHGDEKEMLLQAVKRFLESKDGQREDGQEDGDEAESQNGIKDEL